MAELHYFPEEILAMQEELKLHQGLMNQLLELPPDADLADRMGVICAYCGIVLDGYYDMENVLQLATTITKELCKAREELILDISAPITKH